MLDLILAMICVGAVLLLVGGAVIALWIFLVIGIDETVIQPWERELKDDRLQSQILRDEARRRDIRG